MDRDACFELGYTLKPHGLKGEIEVFLDVDQPEEYEEMESVFVEINKELVPFFIESFFLKDKGYALVKFEEVDSFEDAEGIRSCGLFLPLEVLPSLGGNQFYYHEVIGFAVHDKNMGEIGSVTGFHDAGPQTIMTIDHQGHEVLVPVSDQTVLAPDREKRVLQVHLPDGLLDVYLEP